MPPFSWTQVSRSWHPHAPVGTDKNVSNKILLSVAKGPGKGQPSRTENYYTIIDHCLAPSPLQKSHGPTSLTLAKAWREASFPPSVALTRCSESPSLPRGVVSRRSVRNFRSSSVALRLPSPQGWSHRRTSRGDLHHRPLTISFLPHQWRPQGCGREHSDASQPRAISRA